MLRVFERYTRGSTTPAVLEVVFMRNGATLLPFWGTGDVDALPFAVAALNGTDWLVGTV